MSTFAIGDIQGCLSELKKLLLIINFNNSLDILWFTGDLVNRGPDSLQVLRFIKSLGDKHRIVLGNHDIHLLALAYGIRKANPTDTLNEILLAKDRIDVIEWLRHQRLFYYDDLINYALVHAGICFSWDMNKAKILASEVESTLQSSNPIDFFKQMYGNHQDLWREDLCGIERLRCITNYFTRMRYCYLDGRLNLNHKGIIADNQNLIPWYKLPQRINTHHKIVFGHWAALDGNTETRNVFALDTGCGEKGNGNRLTAMRLEDEKLFSVLCS